MFDGCFKGVQGVSMVIQGWFRDVLRVYQGCSWCFNGASVMFQGYFQGFQGVSSVF